MVYFGIGFMSALVGYFGGYAVRVRLEEGRADLLDGDR
jgi:hypothetical protein